MDYKDTVCREKKPQTIQELKEVTTVEAAAMNPAKEIRSTKIAGGKHKYASIKPEAILKLLSRKSSTRCFGVKFPPLAMRNK